GCAVCGWESGVRPRLRRNGTELEVTDSLDWRARSRRLSTEMLDMTARSTRRHKRRMTRCHNSCLDSDIDLAAPGARSGPFGELVADVSLSHEVVRPAKTTPASGSEARGRRRLAPIADRLRVRHRNRLPPGQPGPV